MILRYQPKIEMAAGLDYVPSSLYSGLNHATRISLYMVAGSRLRDSLNHTSVLVSYSIGSCGHGLYSRPLSPTSTNASLIAHKQRCRILFLRHIDSDFSMYWYTVLRSETALTDAHHCILVL